MISPNSEQEVNERRTEILLGVQARLCLGKVMTCVSRYLHDLPVSADMFLRDRTTKLSAVHTLSTESTRRKSHFQIDLAAALRSGGPAAEVSTTHITTSFVDPSFRSTCISRRNAHIQHRRIHLSVLAVLVRLFSPAWIYAGDRLVTHFTSAIATLPRLHEPGRDCTWTVCCETSLHGIHSADNSYRTILAGVSPSHLFIYLAMSLVTDSDDCRIGQSRTNHDSQSEVLGKLEEEFGADMLRLRVSAG